MKNRLRDNWFKLGIFIILLTAWASIIHYYLYTLPEDLELKAMCAKKAEEFYQNNPPNKKIFAYEYHYNKRLNKCFISVPDSREEFFNNIYRSDSLYDVYENKTMASYLHIMPKSIGGPTFSPVGRCHIGDRTCNSRAEYDAFVKSYMQE